MLPRRGPIHIVDFPYSCRLLARFVVTKPNKSRKAERKSSALYQVVRHRMDWADGELRSADFNDLDRLEPYVCCHSGVHESMLLSDDIGLVNPGKASQQLIGKSCAHLGQGIISIRSRIEGSKKQRSIASRPAAFAADSSDYD